MAEKYKVSLDLPGNENKTVANGEQTYLTPQQAAFIPRSVRKEITSTGILPDAPVRRLVDAVILLADISGFTALGEKLTSEHGDSLGAEKFAEQVSSAISALVNVAHRYEGEVAKIAGDCLICTFEVLPEDNDDGGEAAFERGKKCSLEMLQTIKSANEFLDLHGGLSAASGLQQFHLKELRGSSPRSNSARQKMKHATEAATMSKAEYERLKQRWYLVGGRPIKTAGSLLDRAEAGVIQCFGGLKITRDSKLEDISMEQEDAVEIQRQASRRGTITDKYMAELSRCSDVASAYIPPIAIAKSSTGGQFQNEQRRVVVVFLSLPNTQKEAVKTKGIEATQLNDIYSALRSILAKFEGLMRDFLFEDKGCTMICCWGITQITEVDALRAVLFALEATAACETLGDPCKIGISMGQCFTGVCGHASRCDFVVMGAEINMAARLMGKAKTGSALVSERVYNATKDYMSYDMTDPIEVKGKDGTFRALRPFGRKPGAVRHKSAEEWENAVFVGREDEMVKLRKGLKNLQERKGSAFILEGLAGMGKSAIVWQLQRESIDQNVRYLMGTGSAIEKQTPFFAFSQILCAAANLSSSPSYGEVLALKHTYQLDEDDINALGIMLPSLAKRNEDGTQVGHGSLEGRAARVVLKIFQAMENTVFVFEDAHWIDSQSWIMLQMVLPQLAGTSMVMIVTRPPTVESQMKGGGQAGTEGFTDTSEATVDDEFVEDDDRVKFSRILAALKENSAITLMELGTMGIEAMRELIAKTLEVNSTAVNDDFVKLLDQKAGGIPMYLSSMTNWLKERDVVHKNDDGTIFFNGNIQDIKFPNSIMDTVMERIDSLDEQAKVLIKICACFGFEFRQENLENIAPKFLSSQDRSHLETTLEALAARNLVVPVTGESVSQMMKFTHQIITESAYSLMLDSQKREVHHAIANEYENSSFKFELDVLAYHWLRSGDVGRGCMMLQNAAIKAFSIGAHKECINSLGQAVSYGKDHPNLPYWLAMLGRSRNMIGDAPTGLPLVYRALKMLNDKDFMPQIRSDLALERIKREYIELDDFPVKTDQVFSDIEKAKVIIAEFVSFAIYDFVTSQNVTLRQDYNFTEDEWQHVFDWYNYYALINAYKQNEINQWARLHTQWPQANSFHMVQNDPDFCSRIYRRIELLAQNERVSPEWRLFIAMYSISWYVGISPDMIPRSTELLEPLVAMNEGNMKYAIMSMGGIGNLMFNTYSLGNIKLAGHYKERMTKIRIDSEALDDQKAGSYMWNWAIQQTYHLAILDADSFRDIFTKFFSFDKLFPKTKSTYPPPFFATLMKRMMSNFAIIDGDWDSAESLIMPSLSNGMERFLVMPNNSHMDIFITRSTFPLICLYKHKIQAGEDASIYENGLKAARTSLETFEKVNPGTFRCSGIAHQARITLVLKDRPYAKMIERMEKALEYAVELACLPLDIFYLELEIARWKGDAKKFREVYDKCEAKGLKFLAKTNEDTLAKLESGELQAVDLSFEPEVIEPILTDEERLEKLKEDLKVAKQDMKDAEEEEIMKAARATMKAIKNEIKKLKAEIAEKSKPTIDQAKVDELKEKIAEAQAKQDQAIDDDDDDAEEAASAEIIRLKKELKAMTASIPKQKLEDAKKTDAEINK